MKITFRMWVLFAAVALSLISIFSIPPIIFEKGITISAVETNSSIFNNGLRAGMIIQEINEQPINSLEDYSNAMKPISELEENETMKVTILTNCCVIWSTASLPTNISQS